MVPVLLAACSVPTPSAAVDDVRITGVGLTEAAAEVRIRVDNPLPVPLPLGGVRWAAEVDGRPLLAGEHPRGATVPAGGSGVVVIPVVVRYADVLAAAAGDGPTDLRLTADLSVETPLGTRVLPLSWEATLPQVDPPSLDLVRVAAVGIDRGDLALDLDLRVDLPLDLEVRALGWRATADGARLGSGEAAVRDGGRLTLPLRVDPRATAGAAVTALWNRSATLGLVLEGRIGSPVGEIPVRLERTIALE